MKILMVCLGNICRSPVAEGVMKAKLQKYGVHAHVDSAGLLSYHCGENPDKRAIASAMSKGIDIRNQVARQFSRSDFNEFDLIFAMDTSVYEEIMAMASNEGQRDKVHLLLKYADHSANDVPDPYYGDEKGFDDVFELINAACENIVRKIKD